MIEKGHKSMVALSHSNRSSGERYIAFGVLSRVLSTPSRGEQGSDGSNTDHDAIEIELGRIRACDAIL